MSDEKQEIQEFNAMFEDETKLLPPPEPEPRVSLAGRKPTPIDWAIVDKYAAIGASQAAICEILGIGRYILSDAVRREKQMTWTEYAESKYEAEKAKLAMKFWQLAADYDPHAKTGDREIFMLLAKTKLGFNDKHQVEVTGANGKPIQHQHAHLVVMTDDQLDLEIRRLTESVQITDAIDVGELPQSETE